jgi:predicted O-methyltransferase YrrM
MKYIALFLCLFSSIAALPIKPKYNEDEFRKLNNEQSKPESSLDDYLKLKGCGIELSDGMHYTDEQKNQLLAFILKQRKPVNILEIGFSGGQLTQFLFQQFPKLKSIISIGNVANTYIQYAFDYLSIRYPNRFFFIYENGEEGISSVEALFPQTKYDVIICLSDKKSCEDIFEDILNAKRLAHHRTLIVINNATDPQVKEAIKEAEKRNILITKRNFINEDFTSDDYWIEAHFRLK